jgi:hypothetical protein
MFCIDMTQNLWNYEVSKQKEIYILVLYFTYFTVENQVQGNQELIVIKFNNFTT